jgi:osmoprotectant transport system ATP-binding protein
VIEAKQITKRYGERVALAPTSITFAPKTTTAIVGPSGCGKSTLLRVLSGLIEPDAGKVLYDGVLLGKDTLEGIRRQTGFVLQDGGLFPHLTARANVRLLADVLGRDRDATAARVLELAELVKLSPSRLDRRPSQLSGGERQRVSLMRALALDPSFVLLDEPLGALDPITRRGLQTELRAIFERLGKTVIVVTHDMGEAAYLAETIALLRDGAIVQLGTARELAHAPAEQFVTDFIEAQRPFDPDAAGEQP